MMDQAAQQTVKIGDKITLAGTFVLVRNPARKWWQVWKPRVVAGIDPDKLMSYTVTHVVNP